VQHAVNAQLVRATQGTLQDEADFVLVHVGELVFWSSDSVREATVAAGTG
jgi:hypothetical protein